MKIDFDESGSRSARALPLPAGKTGPITDIAAPAIRSLRHWYLVAACVTAPIILGLLIVAAALTMAGALLSVRPVISAADAIVVLGGNPEPRSRFALQLYEAGLAPNVVVSGAGDCMAARDILTKGGVPPERLRIDCASYSTMENARGSATILKELGLRHVILVTHWYHGRRAAASFRKAAPWLDVRVVPIAEKEPILHLAWTRDRATVLKEYLKIGWYGVRYWFSSPASLQNHKGAFS